MSRGERDTVPILSDTGPAGSTTEREVELRRVRQRSASVLWPSSGTSTGAGDANYMFHTEPLQRRPPAYQFAPRSGPLYGGSNRGTTTPLFTPPPPPPPPPQPEEPPSKSNKFLALEGGTGGWADEAGGQHRKNNRLLNSGKLAMCNDPYCTTCPGVYRAPAMSPRRQHVSSSSSAGWVEFDFPGWVRKLFQFLDPRLITNPHNEGVQRWNKFFVISCLVAIFIDPLFFFVLSVNEENRCIFYDWNFAKAIAGVRTVTDFIYLLHILLQFKLAYVAPESRVVGTGDLVFEPKKVASHYFRGYFLLDLFDALPLPQVMILVVIPSYFGVSAANYAKNMLRVTVLLQYVPRIFRVLLFVAGWSSNEFIFESAWSNFVINLLMFALAGHVVGSCWYLFGFQRVNHCLRHACFESKIANCTVFLDCGRGSDVNNYIHHADWKSWKGNAYASSCLFKNGTFNYGIYQNAPVIARRHGIIVRYIYSFFWGFQQISTLAGNKVPSEFVWEVLFTTGIIGLGLLLFALLIGNIQNFLQSLGRRRLEMQLRRRDVQQWMSHRRFPEDLKSEVIKAERFNWVFNRGVNEEELLKNLPEDLQHGIRRHLFGFLKDITIFRLMDEPILDAFRGILRQRLYVAGSYVQKKGGPIEKMVFIVRGQMKSTGSDGNTSILREGHVCGEELLAWHLENVSVNRGGVGSRGPTQRLFSNRNVRCTDNVEAFILQSSDLVQVTINFERFLRKPRVQAAIRYDSPYWRTKAAMDIQVVWRYLRRRRMRTVNAINNQGRERRGHHLPPLHREGVHYRR